ncbi:HD domain-containing protein [Nocardia tenerifensis]|uniref:HD domain-containing protein n=1 Tax=Nocardia tenerifensis TaxID=228006 RepID=UPI0003053AF7|nr:HD domain-containing protein [Nocardia tenerifensis]
MKLDDLTIPDSASCRAATEVAAAYCTPALFNHSVRSYLWAAGHAQLTGLGFDAELLYVAALLHDLGLVEEFDNASLSFEVSGGHLAWVFGAAAGWPEQRRTRVSEVIVAHMADSVDVAADPEGYLLEHGTSVDISGRGCDALAPEFRLSVLERHPRLGLPEEFLGCFQAQAGRKPHTSPAEALRSGLATRISANPLDRV